MATRSPRSYLPPVIGPSPPIAFSLIEVLVVISIIALLIGIVLPALSSSRQVANNTVCMVNLRQIGIGMEAYAEDHDEMYPRALPIAPRR